MSNPSSRPFAETGEAHSPSSSRQDSDILKRVAFELPPGMENPSFKLLTELNSCRSYRNKDGNLARKITNISNWSLAISLALFAIVGLLSWRHSAAPLSDAMRLTAASLSLISMFLAASTLITSIASSGIELWRWKQSAFSNLLAEIAHDEQIARKLSEYPTTTLHHAVYWLDLKVHRHEMRVAGIFGEKTAVFSLLVLLYAALKELGGIEGLSQTITSPFASFGLLKIISICAVAILLGLSLGAILVKMVQKRYRYQIELVKLALQLKANREPSSE